LLSQASACGPAVDAIAIEDLEKHDADPQFSSCGQRQRTKSSNRSPSGIPWSAAH
jgi:hypothetical protein